MLRLRVPATTANVGPAFDALGIALSLYHYVEAEVIPRGLEIQVTGRDQGLVARDQGNLVYQSMVLAYETLGQRPPGLRLKLHNDIPLGRGLGSSAAAIVGGLAAANYLMGEPFSTEELLELAVAQEGHPDNVAPALLGGVVISCKGHQKTETIGFPVNERLGFYAAVPDQVLSTKEARAVLPPQVSHGEAVFNVGRTALLVAALCSGNFDPLVTALEDKLHQPYRFQLMPELKRILEESEKRGLKNLFLSGAGPTVMLLDCHGGATVPLFQEVLTLLPGKWELLKLTGDNQGLKRLD